jgi:hypothetical protein
LRYSGQRVQAASAARNAFNDRMATVCPATRASCRGNGIAAFAVPRAAAKAAV